MSYALRKKRCLHLVVLSTDKNTDTGLQTNCTPAKTKVIILVKSQLFSSQIILTIQRYLGKVFCTISEFVQ